MGQYALFVEADTLIELNDIVIGNDSVVTVEEETVGAIPADDTSDAVTVYWCSGDNIRSTEISREEYDANPEAYSLSEPDCDGDIVQKKSKRGKIFYGCSKFPECRYATWDKPLDLPCPQCGGKILLEKTTKKDGTVHYCPNKACGYREPA